MTPQALGRLVGQEKSPLLKLIILLQLSLLLTIASEDSSLSWTLHDV